MKENYCYITDRETIYNESSQVLTDPQDKPEHKIETFQDHYILSFNEATFIYRHFRSLSKIFAAIASLTDRATHWLAIYHNIIILILSYYYYYYYYYIINPREKSVDEKLTTIK